MLITDKMQIDNPTPAPASGLLRAIGLMSGTSLDGVDAAMIDTDGERVQRVGTAIFLPYPPAFQAMLRRALDGSQDLGTVSHELTLKHIEAVHVLLKENNLTNSDINIIGFHGQTISHHPERGSTRQIGDAALLATATGIDVVSDFRSADVASGGQGAPLVPLYHQALLQNAQKPVVVLNIGGVANITWIGAQPDEVMACDTGPGNALINDWLHLHTGRDFDEDGALAAAGTVDSGVLAALLAHPYFARKPPKSLDRNSFKQHVATVLQRTPELSIEDGAATLTAFTAASIARIVEHFPQTARKWLVCGGGRHNATLMQMLSDALHVDIADIATHGYHGDSLEAEAFAFLAVRSLKGLPLSLPTTTGVRQPICGGVFTACLKALNKQ